MTDGQALYHAPRCWRCELPNNVAEHESAGWCLFCRRFSDERDLTAPEIWQLASKHPRRCLPAQLGDWTTTGREMVAIDLLTLRGGASATLLTRFVCVDYWPKGDVPLLFETRLSAQDSGASFDDCTRRYASHAEAVAGHAAVRARLEAAQAVVCRW